MYLRHSLTIWKGKQLARNTMIDTITTIVPKYTEDFSTSKISTDESDEINMNID